MSNVVRLVNGGTVQVRTGVIQGIGPQGPRGIAGVQGQQGEQGPIGDTGPMGAILQMSAKTAVLSNNPLAANTDTLINFGSVGFDQFAGPGLGFSNVSFVAPSAGDYLMNVWLRFDDAAASIREIWFTATGVTIARTSRGSVAGSPFFVDLSFTYRAVANDVIQVLARAGSATGVSQGSWAVTRVGSGPPGPKGDIGPQGPVGANGATGNTGPAGTANAGFTKYSDLLPH
jgi:hypothetical protein